MEKESTVELTTDIRLFDVETDGASTITMNWQITSFLDGSRIGSTFMDYSLEFNSDDEYGKMSETYDMLLTYLGKTLTEFSASWEPIK